MVKYWHKKGSQQRGVGWVYASRGGVKKGAGYSARWVYKKPGGSWKAGARWKKTVNHGTFNEASWGSDGHTGPRYPRSTRICVQFTGVRTQACVTLT
ncbi:hypothetical protein [Streptomyces sp. MS2.AVA.5]|uniref:Uncharacterized protein n=1 Tax=Streptomyces achmelvichensis TaxID=3134111 RepID=A0ACC6PL35_9ACTN